MSKLEAFLENFDMSCDIILIDESDNIVYQGKMAKITKDILNLSNVILGSVKVRNNCVEVKIRKH